MGDLQQDLSSPPYSPLDSPDPLNNAYFLNESDFLIEDTGFSHELSTTIIPETPSPLTERRRRLHPGNSDHKTSAALQENIPGYLSTTPSSQRTTKRRRLENSTSSFLHKLSSTASTNGFVAASSLLPPEVREMEFPFTLSKPLSSVGSSIWDPSDQTCMDETLGQPSKRRTSSKRLYQSSNDTRKKPRSTRSKSSLASSASLHRDDGGFLLDAELGVSRASCASACLTADEVVVIEDEDDDDVESMVRSVQMAEDEAFARSLQEQFDIEQRQEEQQRRQDTSTRGHSHMAESYVGLSWISPWTSMINSSSFLQTASELSELQQPRRAGRRQPSRSRSRARHASHTHMSFLDDSQGNNYEALLAFEEQQGSVASKNSLSKAEIQRLPVKSYDPAHSAGKTDCQICFSEYQQGERLRMLPCLHDYHVKCIDRWLKDNATCPICRVDVMGCADFS